MLAFNEKTLFAHLYNYFHTLELLIRTTREVHCCLELDAELNNPVNNQSYPTI